MLWAMLMVFQTWLRPDGLLIEVHPNPSVAKSDASQQLNHDEFKALLNGLNPVAQSVGYKII